MKNVLKIEELIAPIVDDLGYDIVRVSLSGRDDPNLQIMIENKNEEKPIVVEDCILVTRAIEEILDLNLDYQYSLEVSSPGVDRPLTKPVHFQRFLGFEARIETLISVSERKKFRGKLIKASDKTVTIEIDEQKYEIDFDNIIRAKLILTDELMKAKALDK